MNIKENFSLSTYKTLAQLIRETSGFTPMDVKTTVGPWEDGSVSELRTSIPLSLDRKREIVANLNTAFQSAGHPGTFMLPVDEPLGTNITTIFYRRTFP